MLLIPFLRLNDAEDFINCYRKRNRVQSPTESHWSIWRIRDQATTIQYFDRFLPPLLPPHTPTMVYQKKTNRQEHPPEVISLIWALHCMGYSASKIRLENGLPKSTITSIIRRVRKHPSDPFRKALRTGHPPKLNARAERRLVRFMANHPFETITSMLTPLKLGYCMHINTTRRYLAKNHYYAFRPRKKPYLRPHHKTLRLWWARIYRDLQLSDWALVGFSDESTFKLGIDTSPPWTRRKIGEAYKSKNLKPTFKSGRSSVGI